MEENAYALLGLEQGPASTEAELKKVGCRDAVEPGAGGPGTPPVSAARRRPAAACWT